MTSLRPDKDAKPSCQALILPEYSPATAITSMYPLHDLVTNGRVQIGDMPRRRNFGDGACRVRPY